MFALYDGPCDLRFEKLMVGEQPLYEGTSEVVRLRMSRFMPPEDADRLVCAESQHPKPRRFLFVAWQEHAGHVAVGFSSDPAFRRHSRERPPWFKSLSASHATPERRT